MSLPDQGLDSTQTSESDHVANTGMKPIAWVAFLVFSAGGCGVEWVLLNEAMEKSAEVGIVAFVPAISIGIIGMLAAYTAVRNLLSEERIARDTPENWL